MPRAAGSEAEAAEHAAVDHRAHCTRPAAVSRRCRSAGDGASMRSVAPVIGCVDGKPPRVQRLAREGAQGIRGDPHRRSRARAAAVLRIADERPAGRGEVDADLMHAAGHEPASQQRQAGGSRATRPSRSNRVTLGAPARRRHDPPAIVRVAAEAQVDDSAGARRHGHRRARDTPSPPASPASARCMAACARAVFAPITMPEVSLSSRPTIDGAIRPAPAAGLPEQRVHDRAFGVAVGRVDDEPGRLVDGDQVLVLVEDVERQLLGRHRRARRDEPRPAGRP